MSDDNNRLSRRRILGAIGGIGAAGAFGGGTSALFWDAEQFGSMEAPNVLQAGELDLKVDWEEHYVDWIGSETEVDGVRMVEGAAGLEANETGLPTPDEPMLAVRTDDTDENGTTQIDEFMDATIVESSELTDQPEPVITLEDVKPGDFGEVTLSYHIEGNDAHVSLCTDVLADADNGFTEPEDKVNGHTPDESDGTEGGDLGEHLQAAAWYDPNCDNLFTGGEVEVIGVTDVSESMNNVKLPGTPNVDGDAGDQDTDGNDTALEAVKAAVGDFDGDGFLSNICMEGVEVGSVSAATNLHHLDDLSDGDDSGAGFDGDDLDMNLDKALFPASDSGQLAELKQLFAGGTDFDPDWDTDDPTNTQLEAERPYTEDGGSSVPEGVQRGHRALIPDGTETSIPDGNGGFLEGIDPSGNAAAPGEARKIMVVTTDGAFSEADDDPVAFAQDVSARAGQDEIDIAPILVNDDPTPQDVEFVQALTTNGQRYFATHYDPASAPADCPDAITDAGETCTSLLEAMDSLGSNICATAGGEQRIAGPASIDEVMSELDECQVLNPMMAGATQSEEFGGSCTAAGSGGCVALAWWLPRDIPGVNDNIVQSDVYEFTMGFEAVQCRHNSGESPDTSKTAADAEAGQSSAD